MSDISVQQFQAIIDDWNETRDQIDKLKDQIEPLNKKQRELDQKILTMLDALNLDKFEGTKGAVERRTVDYVNQPPDETRAEFITYLENSGELNDLITFHQGRLTSWYKSKKEELGMEFKPPGLGEMKQRQELRRKKL